MLNKKLDYGLVLIERLKAANGAYLDAKKIAGEHSLPPSYMEKVAQEFKRGGWLLSRRGSGGGYKLLKEEASAADVISFFERPYKICPINRIVKNKL
ncbi:MAG: Rrf2 family transcriptional regulator [bacterium]|nr:Rrf2 family transcriptional regulator [bacterium]